MNIIKTINDASLQCYVFAKEKLPLVVLGSAMSVLMVSESIAEGVNHLAALKDDVGATFGKGSDMEYYLLLAEGLAGAYGYIKSKNIAVLGGLPVLMMFTHWALK